jgi:hypothetical protein
LGFFFSSEIAGQIENVITGDGANVLGYGDFNIIPKRWEDNIEIDPKEIVTTIVSITKYVHSMISEGESAGSLPRDTGAESR